MATFDVQVVDSRQRPLKDVRVRIEFIDLGRQMSDVQHTDGSGVAHFNNHKEGRIRVYVNTRQKGVHFYRNQGSITIVT